MVERLTAFPVMHACHKTFTQAGSLKTHAIIHSGVKPFECETCNKTYIDARSLKAHEIIHTGVKPFECETCHKRFTWERSEFA